MGLKPSSNRTDRFLIIWKNANLLFILSIHFYLLLINSK